MLIFNAISITPLETIASPCCLASGFLNQLKLVKFRLDLGVSLRITTSLEGKQLET